MLSYLSKWKASTTNLHSLPVGSKLLSYLSKWKVSTTICYRCYGNHSIVVIPLQMKCFYNGKKLAKGVQEFLSCHTSPNERFLQRLRQMQSVSGFLLSYLSKWKASTTSAIVFGAILVVKVVIPLQMKGFYNIILFNALQQHWNFL